MKTIMYKQRTYIKIIIIIIIWEKLTIYFNFERVSPQKHKK
jgi:hypothetical protein